MNNISPQWLQHFYEPWSDADLSQQLIFSESVAEKHMLETEIKRREDESNDQSSGVIARERSS